MSRLDEERIPVLVGGGRYTQPKSVTFDSSYTPLTMMDHTARLAAADSGAPDPATLLSSLQLVGVVQTATEKLFRRPFPKGVGAEVSANWPRSLANLLGAQPAALHCVQTYEGGNSPQMLLNMIADKISRGEISSAVVSGVELQRTFYNMMKQGAEGAAQLRNWMDTTAMAPAVFVGPQYTHSAFAQRHGLHVPLRAYPLLEQAMRREAGVSVEEHMAKQSTMFAKFSQVASESPKHSWFPTRHNIEAYDSSAKGNRMVGYPYTKLHCAVMAVDQSASVLMMSLAEAKRQGVPTSHVVYLHACAEAVDKSLVDRPSLTHSPAVKSLRKQLLSGMPSGFSLQDDVQFKDIYSCFPVAVSIVGRDLGLQASKEKVWTVTGGLPYHGGPGSNYATHALAALLPLLRAHPRAFGLATANGGMLDKHAAGLYSCVPYSETHAGHTAWGLVRKVDIPAGQFCSSAEGRASEQRMLDASSVMQVCQAPADGTIGRLQTYTVQHTRDGLYRAVAIGAVEMGTQAGRRFAAISNDKDVMRLLEQQDLLGARVRLWTDDRGVVQFRPLKSSKL